MNIPVITGPAGQIMGASAQKQANRSHARLRGSGEPADAQL
jgi:hypothetical protein